MPEHEIPETLKAALPVTVTYVSWCGMALQDWVYILTITYTAILIIMKTPKLYAYAKCFYKYRSCDRRCRI